MQCLYTLFEISLSYFLTLSPVANEIKSSRDQKQKYCLEIKCDVYVSYKLNLDPVHVVFSSLNDDRSL